MCAAQIRKPQLQLAVLLIYVFSSCSLRPVDQAKNGAAEVPLSWIVKGHSTSEVRRHRSDGGTALQEMGDEVVSSLLDLFMDVTADAAWHGGCLALAELARRGLLLPARLPTLSPLICKGLQFDVRRGPHRYPAHQQWLTTGLAITLSHVSVTQRVSLASRRRSHTSSARGCNLMSAVALTVIPLISNGSEFVWLVKLFYE